MTRVPQIRPQQLAKLLLKFGFQRRQGKGSHTVFYHSDGRYTSIPMHPKPIGKGLLVKILKQVRISVEEVRKNI